MTFVLERRQRLEKKLTFTAIFFLILPDQVDALFNPKNIARTKRNIYSFAIYWSTTKKDELSRHRCCLTLNFGDNANHSCSYRFKPLTEPRVS